MLDALLLEVQRIRRSQWVDSDERVALSRLLCSYDGTSASELGAAVTALLARSADEAAEIARAFERLYLEPVPAAPVSERALAQPEKPSKPVPARRSWLLALAGLLAVALLLGKNFDLLRELFPVSPNTEHGVSGGSTGAAATGGSSSGGSAGAGADRRQPKPDPVVAPPRPSFRERWAVTPWSRLMAFPLGAAVLALGVLGFRAGRGKRDKWSEQRWEALASLSGDRDYDIEAPKASPAVALQQLAYALELAAGTDQRSDRIDVARTVDATARSAIVSLVYASKPAVGRVLVLRDTGQRMMPWSWKSDRLIEEMRRQCAVDLLYFDLDPTQVSLAPGQPTQPIRNWINQTAGLPLVVISDGYFFRTPNVTSRSLRETFAPWPVRVLLHPVDDGSLWPPELTEDRAVLPGFSMSRRGYRSLRRWLPGRAARARERQPILERPLEATDVRRLRGMLSFMPRPSYKAAELLRAALLPHTPESILLTLDPILRPRRSSGRDDVAEARAWLRDWFAAHPKEAETFKTTFWNEHLPKLEPASPAYHRYQRDRAVMKLHLANSEQELVEAEQSVAAFASTAVTEDFLLELGRVQQATRATSDLKRIAKRLKRYTLATTARAGAALPAAWGWPSLWVALPACLGALAFAPLGVAVAPVPSAVPAASTPPASSCKDSERCGGPTCVDFLTDAQHCGSCEVACPASFSCQNGSCGCVPSLAQCAGTCVDLQTSAANCGTCGRACQGQAACVAGQCQACAAVNGMSECKGKCVDLQTDAQNCGSCGSTCAVARGARSCVNGECGALACAKGFLDCNGTTLDGCEVDFSGDARNCGACGRVCTPTQQCFSGKCNERPLCAAGTSDCNKNPGDGCETDLTDEANCGSCRNRCKLGMECDAGRCVLSPSSCVGRCGLDAQACSARCASAVAAPPTPGVEGMRSIWSGNVFGDGDAKEKAKAASTSPSAKERDCKLACEATREMCVGGCTPSE